MTQGRVVPFRAGNNPGEQPEHPSRLAAHPMIGAAGVIQAADISEFQGNVNDAAYVKWSQAVIIRAAYGAHHDDHSWFGGDRRKQFHDNGIRYLGMYQYVTAFEDVTAQARAFCRLVGSMRTGEDIFADIEEGSGNQQARWQTWASVVRSELGWAPGNYSGLFFARDHGLAPVDWVAAYGTAEPGTPHRWWQFTDRFRVPGVGEADCSVFHGGYPELLATAFGGTRPQTDWTEEAIMALPVLREGAKDAAGSVLLVHRIQNDVTGIGRWNNLGTVTQVKDDGVFGPSTTRAVKEIQKFFGLAQDGIVGPDTWSKLIGA